MTKEQDFVEVESYHGCFNGGCPHDKQVECNKAIFAAGWEARDEAAKIKDIEIADKMFNLSVKYNDAADKYSALVGKMSILRRYHGGDGTVTREMVIDALGT